MSQCQCLEPATRLIRVVSTTEKDGYGKPRTMFSANKSARFAACEAHRASAKRILENWWADELKAREVKILMGRRRKAGS